MKVFLTIWISAVLIQEVIPGTLVRLPRHTPKRPAVVQTEYEGKYEQKGQNGNENSALFSGKQEIVHTNCAENWNDFADKCAALVKDLVASLANSVSSRPGDATNLQLQIKNTFKHFDDTHNCTCLNDAVKNNPNLDLSSLFNNITITTLAPTVNNNKNGTGTNNVSERKNCRKQSRNGKNAPDLREGVMDPRSNGDQQNGNGSCDGRDNNIGTQCSHSAGVSRKPNTSLDRAKNPKNPGLSPENNEDSEAGSNSRRQADYPQVSWQPANKIGQSPINHGRSNNIGRSRYPFIVTPQPNSAYGSPAPATSSGVNNSPKGGNGFGPDGQTNSNASSTGTTTTQSGTPLATQPLPATNTYLSKPASASHYKTGVPTSASRNSPYAAVTGVPSAFDAASVPTGPGGHISKNGYTLPKAPVSGGSYDPKPVPVKPMTDGLSASQPETIPSTEPRGPKFPKKNSPKSRDWTNKPDLFLSNSSDPTPEYPQSSDSHSLSKNHFNRPVAEIIQPVPSVKSEDSRLDSMSGTPSTKTVLTTGKPEDFSVQKDKKVGVPVINSDSNIPEWWGPQSQRGATNPLPTGRNPNPSSTPSINHEPEHTTFAPTTDKFSDTISPPSDRVPPSVYVQSTLPEADNHKTEGPSDAEHTLNNPSDPSALPVTLKPSSLPQNFDHLGVDSSENVDGKPKRGVPVTIHSASMPTLTPLGSNGNENSGKPTPEEDDCEEYEAEDVGKTTTATVSQSSGQSLQGSGIPQFNTEEGNSGVQNGIGQTPVSEPNSNTQPDIEDGEECDEYMDSESTTNSETGNHATSAVLPPVHPVPQTSDPVLGSVPVSDDGGENTGFSNYPNGVPHSSSSTGTASDALIPVTVSPVQPVSHPEVQKVQENVPTPEEYEECEEYADETEPVAGSPAQPVPKVSDPAVPASNHGENVGLSIDRNSVPVTSSNTGTTNDATTPVAVSQVKPWVTDSVQGSVPVPNNGGESIGPITIPNNVPHGIPDTGITNEATSLVTASPVQPPLTDQQNIPTPEEYEECEEYADETEPVAGSPAQPVPMIPDPAVQGNIPTSDVGGENTEFSTTPNSVPRSSSKTVSTTTSTSVTQITSGTGASDYPNNVPVPSTNMGTVNHAATPVPVSPVKPVPMIPDPAVQGTVPVSDVGGENSGSSNDPNNLSYFSSGTTSPMSPVKPVPMIRDPVVQGNIPTSAVGGENTGLSNYPNNVPISNSNVATVNQVITPVPVPPIKPEPMIPDPAVQETVPVSDVVGGNTGFSTIPNSVPISSSNMATVNQVITPVPVSPIKPVPMIPDPAVQGNIPTSDVGGENTEFSTTPNNVPISSSNMATVNQVITPVPVSPIKPVPMIPGPAAQETVPVSDVVGGNTGFNNNPNNVPISSSNVATVNQVITPVPVSPIKPVPMIPDPVVQGNIPTSAVAGENTGFSNYPNNVPISSSNVATGNQVITPVPVPPIKPVPMIPDPAVQETVPTSDVGGENTEFSTTPNSVPRSSSKTVSTTTSTSVTQITSGTGASDYPNNVPVPSTNMGTVNHATTPVPVSPVPMIPDPAVQETVPVSDVGSENSGSSNDPNNVSYFSSGTGTSDYPNSVPVSNSNTVSPIKPVPNVSDPAVQETVPTSDVGGENTEFSTTPNSVPRSSSKTVSTTTSTSVTQITSGTGASDYPNNVPVPSTNMGTVNHATTPVPVSPVPMIPDPAVQETVPVSDVGSENSGSSNDPNNVSYFSSGTGTSDYPNSVPVSNSNTVSPIKPVPNVSDPAVQGNFPGSDHGNENIGYSDPNIVSHGSSNMGIANDGANLAVESPVKPLPTVSEPVRQPLESDSSLISKTISGVDGDQDGNNQTPLNITPSPYTYSPDGYTTISPVSEGQSHDPGKEDSALYKHTTFQTTASDPTSPQSILIPTESTKELSKVPAPSHSSIDDDDDEDEEDCCSCESCTEEIADPNLYKENACKNLEEARKELKAIFDKIKKKLKCGRKACNHAIGHVSSGKETSVVA